MRKHDAAVAVLESANESYSASLDAYKYGVKNLVDVVTAENQLARARLSSVSARSELFLEAVNLEFATGKSAEESTASDKTSISGRTPMISAKPQLRHRYEGIVDTFVQLFLSQISSMMASSLPITSVRRDESSSKEDAMQRAWFRSLRASSPHSACHNTWHHLHRAALDVFSLCEPAARRPVFVTWGRLARRIAEIAAMRTRASHQEPRAQNVAGVSG